MKQDETGFMVEGAGQVVEKKERTFQGKGSSEVVKVPEIKVRYWGGELHLRVDPEAFSSVHEGDFVQVQGVLQERNFKLSVTGVVLAVTEAA